MKGNKQSPNWTIAQQNCLDSIKLISPPDAAGNAHLANFYSLFIPPPVAASLTTSSLAQIGKQPDCFNLRQLHQSTANIVADLVRQAGKNGYNRGGIVKNNSAFEVQLLRRS